LLRLPGLIHLVWDPMYYAWKLLQSVHWQLHGSTSFAR